MQCPSCHKEVDVKDKDVGALFTCPQCRSVYFINFDGSPDFGEVEQPSVEELQRLQNQSIPDKKKKKKSKKDSDELEQHEVEAHIKPDQTNAGQTQSGVTETQPIETLSSHNLEPAVFEVSSSEITENENPVFELQSNDNFSIQESTPEQTNESQLTAFDSISTDPVPFEALPSETPSIENFSYESASAVNENPVTPPQAAQDFTSVASELESFGNRQTIVAGISYDLEITGLDTKEAQELLREAIDDSRFEWHPEDIVREIRKGHCKFKNLTPVQAFVLAKRIQFIDIEMKWKQNVLA